MKNSLFASAIALATLSAPVLADIETRQVQFAPGKTVATIKSMLKGRQTVDYAVSAKAGQTLSVSFKTSNASSYFNVLPPGSIGDAIFVGSSAGNDWSGKLDADGEYKVRTYLMRNAARRNETANFTLTLRITDNTTQTSDFGKAPASDAKVKGTPYHATGEVPCSMGSAPPGFQQCPVGVIRGAAGNAEVHITLPDARKRVLLFMGSNVSVDGNNAVKANLSGDLWSVDINDNERYLIREAFIRGG